MGVLSCAYSAYPTHAVSLRAHRGFSPERSTSPVSVSLTRHHHHDHPFVPEAMDTKDAGGREALDQAFAEIVGAESAIVRSQTFNLDQRQGFSFSFSRSSEDLLKLSKIIDMLKHNTCGG